MRVHVFGFRPHRVHQLLETDEFSFHLCGEGDSRKDQGGSEECEVSIPAMTRKMGVIGHWNDRTRPNGQV